MKIFKDLSSKKKILIADLSILFSALLWGGDYIVVKRAMEVIPQGYINAFRFSVAAIVMLPLFWNRIKIIKRSDLLIGSLTGLMMFGGFIGQNMGLKYTTVGNNAFITSAYVIFVPIFVWLLTRNRPGLNSLLAVLLSVAGIGFLSLQGGLALSKGDGITLMGAVFFGLELTLLGIFAKKMDPFLLAFIEASVVGILFWIFAIIFEPAPPSPDVGIVMSMAYMTLFGAVLTHITVTVALKYTSSGRGAVLCATESLFAVILAAIFLGERLSVKGWIGSSLILAAVLLTELGENLFKKRKI